MKKIGMTISDARGFTLLEILVSMALFSAFIGTLYPLFKGSNLVLQKHRVLEEVVQNNRIALRRLVRETRHATAITNVGDASGEPGHYEFDTKYLLNDDSNVEHFHYATENGQLIQEVNMGYGYGAPVVVAEGVQSLTTSYESATKTVRFVLVTSSGGKTYQSESTAQVRGP